MLVIWTRSFHKNLSCSYYLNVMFSAYFIYQTGKNIQSRCSFENTLNNSSCKHDEGRGLFSRSARLPSAAVTFPRRSFRCWFCLTAGDTKEPCLRVTLYSVYTVHIRGYKRVFVCMLASLCLWDPLSDNTHRTRLSGPSSHPAYFSTPSAAETGSSRSHTESIQSADFSLNQQTFPWVTPGLNESVFSSIRNLLHGQIFGELVGVVLVWPGNVCVKCFMDSALASHCKLLTLSLPPKQPTHPVGLSAIIHDEVKWMGSSLDLHIQWVPGFYQVWSRWRWLWGKKCRLILCLLSCQVCQPTLTKCVILYKCWSSFRVDKSRHFLLKIQFNCL